MMGTMSNLLPRLRHDLDFMPSPVADHPGLLIRDPHQYSDTTLVIPPPLVECLRAFDGATTELELRAALVRLSGTFEVGEMLEHLISTLRDAGFLEDQVFEGMRSSRHRSFAEAPVREASHTGGGYPGATAELKAALDGYLRTGNGVPSTDGLIGIAAPHVSPEGGATSYGAAYRALDPGLGGRTFVILGTSHYGEPDRFGLTRKPFRTPFGDAVTDVDLVDRLHRAAPGSTQMEDYCHSTEHSIEFQVVFLQHLFGPNVRILPVLCGSFARSIYEGGVPEESGPVAEFIAALRELAEQEGDRLFWVLGVDMAHMGKRYGDGFDAAVNTGVMAEVAGRDEQRIRQIAAGDSRGFWELVRQNQDDLKWCGSSAFYTFMKTIPEARARTFDYGQWNIDKNSVVTFGALGFYKPSASE
jgi:AmmeMemoRadiSam system protein B